MDAAVTTVTAAPTAAAADTLAVAAAIIEDDLFCVECGYNLRAQRTDALCPECGQPIRRTLEFPHLIRSAPRWLTSLRDSLAVLLVALLADGVAVALEDPRHPVLDICLVTVPWALTWFAVWLLTRREPGAPLRVLPEARRWGLRALASLPYVAFFLDMSGRSTPWWYYLWWGPWVMLGLMLSAAPATFLYYDHLRRSALRLPRPDLALLAAVTRWLVPLIMIASVVQWIYFARRSSASQVLHVFPRPVLPAAQDAQFVWGAISTGTDLFDFAVVMRLVATAALLWSAAVLVMFFLAFQSAVGAARRKGATDD